MLKNTQRDIRIRDVENINHPTHVALPTKGAFECYIELPLIEAARMLTERGVRTVASSANEFDVGKLGYLTIDYDGLSEPNREVAKILLESGDARCSNKLGPTVLIIEFKISKDSTVGSVNDWIMERVSLFHDQRNSSGRSS